MIFKNVTSSNYFPAIFGYGLTTNMIPDFGQDYTSLTDLHVEAILENLDKVPYDDPWKKSFLEANIATIDMVAPAGFWDEICNYSDTNITQLLDAVSALGRGKVIDSDFDVPEPTEELDETIGKINKFIEDGFIVNAVRLLPDSYKLRGILTTNYKVLRDMYRQFYSNKEDNWQKFFDNMELDNKLWVCELPK